MAGTRTHRELRHLNLGQVPQHLGQMRLEPSLGHLQLTERHGQAQHAGRGPGCCQDAAQGVADDAGAVARGAAVGERHAASLYGHQQVEALWEEVQRVGSAVGRAERRGDPAEIELHQCHQLCARQAAKLKPDVLEASATAPRCEQHAAQWCGIGAGGGSGRTSWPPLRGVSRAA